MRSRSIRGGVGAVFLVALAGCGGGSSGQGGVRQACYPNATCNPPLTCVSDVCVDLSGAGGAGGGTAGRGGGGNTGTGGVGNTGGTTAGTGGVGNTGGTTARAGTGGVGNTGGTIGAAGTGGGNTGGAAAGRGGGGNTGGAAAGRGGGGNTGGAAGGAGGTATCVSPTSYTQTTISGGVGQTTGGLNPYEEVVQGNLVAGSTPDILDIELYSTMTDFPGDVSTGTFHLTADDGQYLTCGICILIYAKSTIDNTTGEITPQALYLANAGTLTLTSVANKTTGTGTIAGSISNLTFRQVTIDSNTFESTVVGSCTTNLPSLTFSVTSANAQ